MFLYETLFLISIFLILFVILKKFNILRDNTDYSNHKIIGSENESPVLIGGIFIFISILIFVKFDDNLITLFYLLILLLGVLSDIDYLPNPSLRLILQIIIITFFVITQNLSIDSLSLGFFDELLRYKELNIFFTVFCLTVLLNGSNFIDGLNGLLSGYLILICSSVTLVASSSNFINILYPDLFKIFTISVIIFFVFNLFGRVYLGDSGSYLSSFIIGTALISINSENILISPYYVALLLWYPAFENFFSLMRRVFIKSNISIADKLHLHQLLYRYIRKKKKFNLKIVNSISGMIIIIFNLPSFIVGTYYFFHTKILIIILIFNVILYCLSYFILFKNSKNYK